MSFGGAACRSIIRHEQAYSSKSDRLNLRQKISASIMPSGVIVRSSSRRESDTLRERSQHNLVNWVQQVVVRRDREQSSQLQTCGGVYGVGLVPLGSGQALHRQSRTGLQSVHDTEMEGLGTR